MGPSLKARGELRENLLGRIGDAMKFRRSAIVVGTLLLAPLAASSASATTYFDHLIPREGGQDLAWGHGFFQYDPVTHNPEQNTTFKDQRSDGDGAYAEADFQKYEYICNPQGTCWWAWQDITQKQTDRIGTDQGWQTRTLSTSRAGHSWRDLAKVCVDQSFQPDPCDDTGWIYP
jgi:hypothetical protein